MKKAECTRNLELVLLASKLYGAARWRKMGTIRRHRSHCRLCKRNYARRR